MAHLVVEQECYGVREDFAQQPAGEVPQVARPHSLYGVTLRELAEEGVYPVTKPAKESALSGSGVSLLGGMRSEKLHAHTRQLLPALRGVVVLRSPTISPEVPWVICGSTQSSWALAGATDKRVL